MSVGSGNGLRGIGGWLAFYIVYSLVVAVPIFVLALYFPHEGLVTWSTILDMSLDIVACLMLISKYRYAVRATGISLIASFLIGTAWFIHDSVQAHRFHGFGGLLVAAAQMALWLGYFYKSRRVRNTYGSNLEWYG